MTGPRHAMARARASYKLAVCLGLAALIVPSCFVGMPLTSDESPKLARRGFETTGNVAGDVEHYFPDQPGVYPGKRKEPSKNYRIKLMRRMPTTTYGTEDIMKRIVATLLRNMDGTWRESPMPLKTLMKEVGLRGNQLRSQKYIGPALRLLQGQKVIMKVNLRPEKWEIHEEYRKWGVPPVSWDHADPFKYNNLLKFKRVKKPKYGPANGMYRPEDREFLKSRGLPLTSIHDPYVRTDPWQSGDYQELSEWAPEVNEFPKPPIVPGKGWVLPGMDPEDMDSMPDVPMNAKRRSGN